MYYAGKNVKTGFVKLGNKTTTDGLFAVNFIVYYVNFNKICKLTGKLS